MHGRRNGGGVVLVDQVPEEDKAVICAGGKDSTAIWRPLNGVEGGGMALEFEEGLTRLANVKHTHDVGILGESSQEVGVVRRR